MKREKTRSLGPVAAAFRAPTVVAVAWAMLAPAAAWEMRVCADPYYMPFSNRDEMGFENRIARILAEELGAELTYQWWPQTETMVSEMLRTGNCDMIMGVPDRETGLLPSLAYYQSPYVFVQRADSDYEIRNFDDPILRELRLGVQSTNDAAHVALGKRGLTGNVDVQFVSRPDDDDGPFAPLIEAVANGVIDVAVPWGPIGGYYAALQPVELTVTQTPAFELPFKPMFINVVVGVRRGDLALRDRLNTAIAHRWDEIGAVLEEYRVPTIPLAPPIDTLVGGQP